jgi:hypothetical protein
MFKIIALALLLIGSNQVLLAQCFPDSSISSSQIYGPTPEEGFPVGEVGSFYDAVLTLNVPLDTTYLGLTVILDSMVLTSITGIPDDFDYQCNPSGCIFYGGEAGCISISGTAFNTSDAKVWNVVANFDYWITFGTSPFSFSDQVTDYNIDLTGFPAGISASNLKQLPFLAEPNPANISSKIYYQLPHAGNYSLKIYSLLGTEILNAQSSTQGNAEQFNLGQLSLNVGIYFATLQQQDYNRTLRFVVK